ncbi:unnamed protein product [Blepharisma stoltei]|uniref:ELYS-like domain-containing protein n=1 Tax=Blepharisma stoltei TaxID=1481888 RepID=A0AAU9JIZ9_9CILI|nr:unnamed protein product [Blepharisma stoltei]
MKHKISGLGAWEDLKIPAISGLCSTTQSFGLVWHHSDVVILDFKHMRSMRALSTGNNGVDFAHISGFACFLVCQDKFPSSITIFDIASTQTKKVILPGKLRCTYVEHIEDFDFIVGTDQGTILIYLDGSFAQCKELTETEKTSVTCIKYDINSLGRLAAVGLGTGDIVVVELDELSEFRLPDFTQKGGKVTGIDFIASATGVLLAVFREEPSSFTVTQIAEENKITEIARIDYPRFTSLLQMSVFENSMLFLAALSGTELEVSIYHPVVNQTELIILDQKEFTLDELNSVVNITIPETSIFKNKIEFGCDLWILGRGGSELQVFPITSSESEKITQNLVTSCMDHTIWQKPETLERILVEYEKAGIKSPAYYQDMMNPAIISVLVKEKKSNVVSEFMLRKFQDSYLLPEEYISIIESWLKKDMIDVDEEVKTLVIDEYLILEKQGNDYYRIVKHAETMLSHCYQIKDIAVAIDIRKSDNSYIENVVQKIHVLKFICWILRSDATHYLKLEGWNWNERRAKRKDFFEKAKLQYSQSNTEIGLFIDNWVNNRPFPPTVEQLIDILNGTDERTFQAIFQYLLLDLSEYAKSAYHSDLSENIDSNLNLFKASFLFSTIESYKISGFWHLDMLSDPSCFKITEDPEKQFFYHAKSSLYSLSEAKDILSIEEKKKILKTFYETEAYSAALLWGKTCGIDLTDPEVVELMLLVFFEGNMWIQAFNFLNGLSSSLVATNHGIALFIHLMDSKNNSQYLPFIPFKGKLEELFLSHLCTLLPHIYSFALIFRKRYSELFRKEGMEENEGIEKVIGCFKNIIKGVKVYDNYGDEIPVQTSIYKAPEKGRENQESDMEIVNLEAPHPDVSNVSIEESLRPSKLVFSPNNK